MMETDDLMARIVEIERMVRLLLDANERREYAEMTKDWSVSLPYYGGWEISAIDIMAHKAAQEDGGE